MKTYPQIRTLLQSNATACINTDGAFDPPQSITAQAMHLLAKLDPDFYENAVNGDAKVERLLLDLAVNDRVQTVMDLRALMRALFMHCAEEHCAEYAGDVAECARMVDPDRLRDDAIERDRSESFFLPASESAD